MLVSHKAILTQVQSMKQSISDTEEIAQTRNIKYSDSQRDIIIQGKMWGHNLQPLKQCCVDHNVQNHVSHINKGL